MNDVLEEDIPNLNLSRILEEENVCPEEPEQSLERRNDVPVYDELRENIYFLRMQQMVEEQFQLIENIINTPEQRRDPDEECSDLCVCICYTIACIIIIYLISYIR